METVLKAIADWIKGILTAGIMSNLSGLFDAVNEQVGDIAQQVGTQPSSFEPRVFAMIESLSRNVVLPIAGIILTFIACYELIEMITQHNNMTQFEPALIMRWIFKTAVSVWLISNTFDIVMAVFDLTQKVVSDSSGIIAGNTRVNEIGLSMLEASLMQMDVGPLFGLFLQSFFIGITMRILSIVIFAGIPGHLPAFPGSRQREWQGRAPVLPLRCKTRHHLLHRTPHLPEEFPCRCAKHNECRHPLRGHRLQRCLPPRSGTVPAAGADGSAVLPFQTAINAAQAGASENNAAPSDKSVQFALYP